MKEITCMHFTQNYQDVREAIRHLYEVNDILVYFRDHPFMELRQSSLIRLQNLSTDNDSDAELFESIIKRLASYNEWELWRAMVGAYVCTAGDLLAARAIEMALHLELRHEVDVDCSKQIAWRLCRLPAEYPVAGKSVFNELSSLEKYLLELLAPLDPPNFRKESPDGHHEYAPKVWFKAVRALTIINHFSVKNRYLLERVTDLRNKLESGLISPNDEHSKFGKDIDRQCHLIILDSVIRRCSPAA